MTQGTEGQTRQPNILFIHTDQQRADTLGCYGNLLVKTPNLDRLADQGVTFDNIHCTHPLCMPSRATLLTGRYVRAHKLWRNGIPLDRQEKTIADILRNQGYATGLIGKAHFTPYRGDPAQHPESVQLNNGVEPTECWDYWRGFTGPYYGFEHVQMSMGHGSYGMLGGHYGLWLHKEHPELVSLFAQEAALEKTDNDYPSWKSAVPLKVHSSTWITDRTIDFIKTNQNRPFYAWVGFQEPHEPFNPPHPYCDMYDPAEVPMPVRRDGEWGNEPPEHIGIYLQRHNWPKITEAKEREIIAHYYGMITLIDDAVGRILMTLDETGLADNTVVVFTSDHGEWLGDHRLWLKGAVHTRGLTRVPMIVRWPGVGMAGHHVQAVSSHVDVIPTLLDAANTQNPYGVQGKTLRPVLKGERSSVRPYALIEHRHEGWSERAKDIGQHPREVIMNPHEQDFYMKTIVTDRYRLTYMPSLDYGELFDIENDPNELANLWHKEPELRKQLQLQLLDALIETEDPLPERTFPV